MRARKPRYRAFDTKGNLIVVTDSEQRAREAATKANGTYREEWVDGSQA